jgi:hypothetical protein
VAARTPDRMLSPVAISRENPAKQPLRPHGLSPNAERRDGSPVHSTPPADQQIHRRSLGGAIVKRASGNVVAGAPNTARRGTIRHAPTPNGGRGAKDSSPCVGERWRRDRPGGAAGREQQPREHPRQRGNVERRAFGRPAGPSEPERRTSCATRRTLDRERRSAHATTALSHPERPPSSGTSRSPPSSPAAERSEHRTPHLERRTAHRHQS